jgi:hypothetical protein
MTAISVWSKAKRVCAGLFFLFLANTKIFAQNEKDSLAVLQLNQLIDDHVVNKNVIALDSIYGDDFVFSHGSGKVEGKNGWMATVGRANYPMRAHDSVKVELHPGIAIVKGKMNISKINKTKTDRYSLKYIRVYAFRGYSYRLISHHTTYESHEQ